MSRGYWERSWEYLFGVVLGRYWRGEGTVFWGLGLRIFFCFLGYKRSRYFLIGILDLFWVSKFVNKKLEEIRGWKRKNFFKNVSKMVKSRRKERL